MRHRFKYRQYSLSARATVLLGLALMLVPSARAAQAAVPPNARPKPPSRQRQKLLEEQSLRRQALSWPSDRDELDVALRRTAALLADLNGNHPDLGLGSEAKELKALTAASKKTPISDAAARNEVLSDLLKLRRRIAFSNPLLDFDSILFIKRNRASYNHMCDQYFGFHANPGGGVYRLEAPFGEKPKIHDLLAQAVVQNGRLAGKNLAGGSFMSLELSYDAKTILFAWTEGANTKYKWSPESTYHIFKMNSDGSNLVQLTDGAVNDFDPCFLPNGRIAFISERRGGFGRCHGRPVPTYTLHSMNDDGSDIAALSYHETNEWHPSVDNNGMIVFSRWDYVDRDSDIAHHIWLTYPDGRDARSYHGNYPLRREQRPWMELSIRAIPNSHRYIGVAAPHHGQNYGSLIMIDHRPEDDHAMSQLKRITPDVPFPESERGRRENEVYGQPWPLSEDYYLCVYNGGIGNVGVEKYGLYLLDSFGNKELLYRDENISCLDPIPFRARPRPPEIPAMTRNIATEAVTPDAKGTVAIMNVYDSDFAWPENTRIAALRIVQIFPKATPNVNGPRIGMADQSLARGVLGTVPVEADGSAYFEAPAGAAIYLQVLDERGQAIQSMKADTYLHPGEQLTCQGCHEPKHRTVSNTLAGPPTALQRSPSKIAPDVDGSYPLLYPRLVQGVLDRNCVACHDKEEKAPSLSGELSDKNGWSKSFKTLSPYGWGKHGGNGALHRKNKTSRSIAGNVGAQASKLYRMLKQGHHQVKLSDEDMYRITLWLDCNTNFFGAYHDTQRQAKGIAVLPKIQ
ncbi:hypothetical protein ACFL34_03600 [Candidatus Sumerlaeota bacterium]